MTAAKRKLKTIEAATRKKQESRKQQPNLAETKQNPLLAQRAARSNSKELSAMFKQKALDGDLASARLLITMADHKKATPPPKKKRRGLTYAQQLALDPPWQGELPAPFVSIYDTKPKPA